jgi:hypothetical protein
MELSSREQRIFDGIVADFSVSPPSRPSAARRLLTRVAMSIASCDLFTAFAGVPTLPLDWRDVRGLELTRPALTHASPSTKLRST